jgi:hypothetical protein
VILGIVGSEESKFTERTKTEALRWIRDSIPSDCTKVISGACHLGGIDTWAIQVAREYGLDTQEYPPEIKKWEGGYKQRNIAIAENCDRLICITLKELPPEYTGMRFDLCYHCGTADHVKSGGCWTMKYARNLGKQTQLIVIN